MISIEAIQDMQSSTLAQSFASLWIDEYPTLDLMTECPFVPGRRYRADFAWGKEILFHRGKPKLLLPPAILIECDGGVHRAKWDEDKEKEDEAFRLGFKLHRLTEARVFPSSPWLAEIASDIQAIQSQLYTQQWR
jgi:hypothetical protein